MAHVLIVDDDGAMRRVLSLQLNLAGIESREASNAQQAFVSLKQELPDLVLLDVMMPPIDGIEICRRIRLDPATMALPVIMVSAYASDANRERAMAAGATALVAKPYESDTLLATLRRYLPQAV